MKILFVTNMYPTVRRPTFGIFVARQAEALRAAGVDVVVEAIAGDRGEADYFLARARIRRAIRRERPDLIHCHYGYSPLAAAWLGRPYVVTLCGDDLNGESDGRGGVRLKSRIGTVVTKTLAAGASRVIVVSEAMRELLPRRIRARCVVLPYGIDERIFSTGSRADARRHLGLPATGLVLTFVNSCRQRTKRLDVAQATLAELHRRGVTAQLLVAEDVPGDEMPWYYRAANCLIMASEREGTPNCVLESLSCGVPVASVAVGDMRRIIDRPERGMIAAREPAALADAVLSLCNGMPDGVPGLLPADVSAQHVTARLIDIYRSVAASA